MGGKKYSGNYYIAPTSSLKFVEGHTVIVIMTENNVANINSNDRGKIKLTQYIFMQLSQSEENLTERLNKAVNHLATFCPKKKETF